MALTRRALSATWRGRASAATSASGVGLSATAATATPASVAARAVVGPMTATVARASAAPVQRATNARSADGLANSAASNAGRRVLNTFWFGARWKIRSDLEAMGGFYYQNQNNFSPAACTGSGAFISSTRCGGTRTRTIAPARLEAGQAC